MKEVEPAKTTEVGGGYLPGRHLEELPWPTDLPAPEPIDHPAPPETQ
jgi:hypothetical protein